MLQTMFFVIPFIGTCKTQKIICGDKNRAMLFSWWRWEQGEGVETYCEGYCGFPGVMGMFYTLSGMLVK